MAAGTGPDVVVMDIRMPVMDGLEATRLITAGQLDPSPRVLILTTFDLDEYVFRALRAGASGFALKSWFLADRADPGDGRAPRAGRHVLRRLHALKLGRRAGRRRAEGPQPGCGRAERPAGVHRLVGHAGGQAGRGRRRRRPGPQAAGRAVGQRSALGRDDLGQRPDRLLDGQLLHHPGQPRIQLHHPGQQRDRRRPGGRGRGQLRRPARPGRPAEIQRPALGGHRRHRRDRDPADRLRQRLRGRAADRHGHHRGDHRPRRAGHGRGGDHVRVRLSHARGHDGTRRRYRLCPVPHDQAPAAGHQRRRPRRRGRDHHRQQRPVGADRRHHRDHRGAGPVRRATSPAPLLGSSTS